MATNGRPMSAAEWSYLLTLSEVWGGSFSLYKVLDAQLPVPTMVLGRVGIAAAVMQLGLLTRRDHIPLSVLPWRQFAVMALLNNVVPFSLIVFAEKQIPSGLASILNATTPVFTVIVAHWLGDERLTAAKVLGVALGFLGVALLMAPHLTTIAALVGLALLCTAWAYQIYFRLLASAGATNLLLVTVLSPVSAVILGALFLSERIGWAALTGLATIGIGLAATDGRPLRFLRGRPRAAQGELR